MMKITVIDYVELDALDGMSVDEVCMYLKSKEEWVSAKCETYDGCDGGYIAFVYEREETAEEKEKRLAKERKQKRDAEYRNLMNEKMKLIQELDAEKFKAGKFEELGFFPPVFRKR